MKKLVNKYLRVFGLEMVRTRVRRTYYGADELDPRLREID